MAVDWVARGGGCDEDMDVGSISNAGMRPAGCDEDLMGSIPYDGIQSVSSKRLGLRSVSVTVTASVTAGPSHGAGHGAELNSHLKRCDFFSSVQLYLEPTKHSNELSVSCTLVSLLCAHEPEKLSSGYGLYIFETFICVRLRSISRFSSDSDLLSYSGQ